MGQKNPELCHHPYCREPWTRRVSGLSRNRRILHVCEFHAKPYMEPFKGRFGSITVSDRERPIEEKLRDGGG